MDKDKQIEYLKQNLSECTVELMETRGLLNKLHMAAKYLGFKDATEVDPASVKKLMKEIETYLEKDL